MMHRGEEGELELENGKSLYYRVISGDDKNPGLLSARSSPKFGKFLGMGNTKTEYQVKIGQIIRCQATSQKNWVQHVDPNKGGSVYFAIGRRMSKTFNSKSPYLSKLSIGVGSKVILKNDKTGMIKATKTTPEGEQFVIQFDDGSNERTVSFEELKAQLGKGSCVNVVNPSSPWNGKKGLRSRR